MKKTDSKGFTMIELLIVVAIIGVLAGIAIPQFGNYRYRSYNSASEADLRNAATAQEGYYIDALTYAATPTSLVGSTYGLYTSAGVTLGGVSDTSNYTLTACHSNGNRTYTLTGPGGSMTH